jgi:hypothetical protein
LRAGAGGIRGLRDLIRRHPRALDADLRAEYGVRLRDLYQGGITYRELAGYVQGLPPQSRVRTALNDGTPEPQHEELLLADLFDMLQRVNWTIQAVNATSPPKMPKPYPRRWLRSTKNRKAPDAQRTARLEAARARARARRAQLKT